MTRRMRPLLMMTLLTAGLLVNLGAGPATAGTPAGETLKPAHTVVAVAVQPTESMARSLGQHEPNGSTAIRPNVSGGGCSAMVDSGYHWSQNACIGWTGSQMYGNSTTQFITGFNRGHVTACQWEGTIVSSYGTATTYDMDCYDIARVGGDWGWTQLLGPGRSVGDKYSWHVCLRVWTSVLYDSCATKHPASPLLTR